MNISYDYYRTFYFVAKCGNITQAASLLLNNQPNVTRIIKNLETELGCILFIRSHHGVHLTPEGKQLFDKLSEKMILNKVNLNEAIKYNSSMITSVKYNKKREAFFAELNFGKNVIDLLSRYTKIRFIVKLKNKIKMEIKKIINLL